MAYTPTKPAPSTSPAPEQIALQSSFLQTATYDAANYSLTVEFKTGEPFIYRYVFPVVWEQFKQHPSPGKFWNESVKGKFPTINLKRGLKVSDIEKAKKKSRTGKS